MTRPLIGIVDRLSPVRHASAVRRVARTVVACVAASLTLAGPAAAETLIVRAGRLLDVERGLYLDDQAIRIADGRVLDVSPWAGPPADISTEVIDWSAYTVLPGLIDLHTHLIGDLFGADPAQPLTSSPAREVLLGASHARQTLAAGFTTVRDVGTYRAFLDVALRDAINAGLVPGPRMFVAGAYITVSQGGGEVTGLPPGMVVPEDMRRGVANSADAVRQRVRELLAGGADFIKIIATGAVLTEGTEPGASEYTEAELRAAVEEAAHAGSYVVAHAHGAEGIRNAVRAGVRSIEHGSLLDDEGIRLMREHGTWLVADVYNGDYIAEVGRREGWSAAVMRKNEETTAAQRAGFRKAVLAGVRIGFGTDSGVYPHGENARQFAYMVRHGMSPLEAIRAATIGAATALGREHELGSVAAGKYADMIAVRGDPLADVEGLRSVAAVVKAGRVVAVAGQVLQ
ncbi:MAG: amidohydrolase family protein [Gammaproteobacteria bacterium]|nr:MAG: amidohydrolase family protein [Gammaproteobacteria bacterium]